MTRAARMVISLGSGLCLAIGMIAGPGASAAGLSRTAHGQAFRASSSDTKNHGRHTKKHKPKPLHVHIRYIHFPHDPTYAALFHQTLVWVSWRKHGLNRLDSVEISSLNGWHPRAVGPTSKATPVIDQVALNGSWIAWEESSAEVVGTLKIVALRRSTGRSWVVKTFPPGSSTTSSGFALSGNSLMWAGRVQEKRKPATNQVQLVDLLTRRSHTVLSAGTDCTISPPAVAGNVWTGTETGNCSGRSVQDVYWYDPATGRMKLLTHSRRALSSHTNGRYIAWVTAPQAGDQFGKVTLFDTHNGKSKVLSKTNAESCASDALMTSALVYWEGCGTGSEFVYDIQRKTTLRPASPSGKSFLTLFQGWDATALWEAPDSRPFRAVSGSIALATVS